MTLLPERDTFSVGDKITWGGAGLWSKFGKGPFTVKTIESVHSDSWKNVGHKQWIYLEEFPEDRISGFWFKRLD